MTLFHVLALMSFVKIIHAGGSHSLWYLVTLTSGLTPFPELLFVKMVDDFPVGYYDSMEKRMVAWRNWEKEENEVLNPGIWQHILEQTKNMMTRRFQLLKKHYNHSKGFLTYQRLSLCELDTDGTERFKTIDAYNGEDVFEFISDSRVHPRVRVIHKQDRDTGGMEVTCLATGFYPRHINMTLKRNTQPVPDQELTRGEPLPNGDGTYQLRRSLSVSAEKLNERHLYTCTVTHSSVDNKMDVSWEFQPGQNNLALSGISFGVLTALAFIMFGLCIWKKRDTEFRKALQSVSDVQHTAVGVSNDESSGASEPLQGEVSEAM
ncbi:major histocompatibility complex class I-related gene protein-like [Megalops cyprinoides]|uniref:major histocompatibility complex class I-related gene protein-like n=1 Tax=Megalops cyprinoides TaxID=118141 RepID=UPI001864128E|nr:major histocompatibility complex class I-related gene protein-like [Megalops cyprinoides]